VTQAQFAAGDSWRQMGGGPQHYFVTPNTVPKGKQLKFLSGYLGAFSDTWGFVKSSSDIFFLAAIWPQPGAEPMRIVTAVQKDGVSHLWRKVMGRGSSPGLRGPALSNDEKLLFYVDGRVIYAFNAATGAEVWKSASPNGSPVVASNGVVYVVGEEIDHNFRAYDGATGKLLWASEFSMIGTGFYPCALDEKETICVTAQYQNTRVDGLSIFAFSLNGGKLLWKTPIAPAPILRDNKFTSWPLVRNNVVWAPISVSMLMLLDATTGAPILNGISNYTGITAPLGLAGGPVLFSTVDMVSSSYVYQLCMAQNTSSKYTQICFDKQLNMTVDGRTSAVGMTSAPLITKDLTAIFFIGNPESRQGQLVAYDLQTRSRLWSYVS
jgi:hypothetical protein